MRGMWGRLLPDLMVGEIMILLKMVMKSIIGSKFGGTVETFRVETVYFAVVVVYVIGILRDGCNAGCIMWIYKGLVTIG
jgi:hypothetical protein